MLSRLTRIQLVMFGVITVTALLIMALYYVRIPAQLGFGRFDVIVQLDNAGGLYPKAHVTYRGTEIGQVTSLEVREGGGVAVHMQIDNDADVPADSQARVRSASVIGEQYVDFVPPDKATTSKVLAGGSVITPDRTDLPTSTDEVLSSADALLKSIPADALSNTLDELNTSFAGSGQDLRQLITSSSQLVTDANANFDQTVSLIDNVGPVLKTQKEMDGNIRSFVGSLDTVTGELAANQQHLRTIFKDSSPFLKEIGTWADQMNPIFAKTLRDVADVGAVAKAYDPAVEHILTVLPALQTMFVAAMPVNRRNDPLPAINLFLRAGFDTPVCNQGFASANKFRDPDDKTLLPPPSDSYCKVPPSSPLVVRGARNSPCPNSALRGPYAFNCGLVFDKQAVARQKAMIATGDVPNQSYAGEGTGSNFFLDALSGDSAGRKAGSLADLMMGGSK